MDTGASYEPRAAAQADLEATNHSEQVIKRRTATLESKIRELQEAVAELEKRLAEAEMQSIQFQTALAHEEQAHEATRRDLRDLRDAFNHQWAERDEMQRKATLWDAQCRKQQLDGAQAAYRAVTGK